MKKKCFALAVLAALSLAHAASALDAVSLLTGGSVTEAPDVVADAFALASGAVVDPYQPGPDADSCAARAEAVRRQLEDLDKLPAGAAAVRFGVGEDAVVRRKDTLAALKNVYPAIVSALSRKAHIESMLNRRRADISAPELTLTEKPPYTLDFYNAYIGQLDELNSHVDDAKYDFTHAAEEAERARRQVSEREATWRLARDTFLRKNTPQTAWQLADASFLTELSRARWTLDVLKRENAAIVLEIRKLARDRHLRVRSYIRDNLDLEEKSFAAQTAVLDARARDLEARRAQANVQYRLAQEGLEAAQAKYVAARSEDRAAALIERNAREDARDAARQKLEHMQSQLDLTAARKRAWTLRYELARGAAGASAIPDAVRELTEGAGSLDEQLAATQKDMLVMQARLAAVQKQIDAGASAASLPLLREDHACVQAAIDDSLAHVERLLGVRAQQRALIDELRELYETVPLREKLKVWWETHGTRLLNTELWQSGGYAVRLREFLLALALIVVGNWSARRVFALLLWSLSKKFSIDETSRRSLTRLFSYLAGLIIFLAALHIVGIPLTAFAFLGGAVAIGIGFGTQNLFKNLVSGILLTLKRPFRLGNVIEVDDVTGTVSDIGVSATIVRTFDGKDVVIPNSDLLEKQLVNWSLSDATLRSTIDVGVEYGTSPKRLREVLLSVLAANPHVLKTPVPLVRLTGYGESELEFQVVFWVNQRRSSAYAVACELREDFIYALEDAGIQMAYPHVDVNIYRNAAAAGPERSGDDSSPRA